MKNGIFEKIKKEYEYKDGWYVYKSSKRKNKKFKAFNWKLYVQIKDKVKTDNKKTLYEEITEYLKNDIEHKIHNSFKGDRAIVIYPLDEDEAVDIIDELIQILEKYKDILIEKDDKFKLQLARGLAMRYEIIIKPEKYDEFFNEFLKICKECRFKSKDDFKNEKGDINKFNEKFSKLINKYKIEEKAINTVIKIIMGTGSLFDQVKDKIAEHGLVPFGLYHFLYFNEVEINYKKILKNDESFYKKLKEVLKKHKL